MKALVLRLSELALLKDGASRKVLKGWLLWPYQHWLNVFNVLYRAAVLSITTSGIIPIWYAINPMLVLVALFRKDSYPQ